ncbi:MAG: hypothetical protein LBC45_00410 [Chlamydiales bacterium]|nr:hypothetical protein [Chlamydiales bacterium]
MRTSAGLPPPPGSNHEQINTDQIVDPVSLYALIEKQILQDFVEIQKQCSPEQIQEIFLQFPSIITKMKLMIVVFKQRTFIDTKLASLLSAVLKEFDIAREQNSITQERKEKLDNMLHLVKHKLINSMTNKQIEPLLVKTLIPFPSLIQTYINTLNMM